MHVPASLAPLVAVTVAVGDPTRTRVVQVLIGVLILIGIVLAATAVWLVRVTRHDHPVLGPLEMMGLRSWRRLDPVQQRRELDEVRPPEAQPLAPMRPEPEHDVEFDRGPRLSDISDLAEPSADDPSAASSDDADADADADDDADTDDDDDDDADDELVIEEEVTIDEDASSGDEADSLRSGRDTVVETVDIGGVHATGELDTVAPDDGPDPDETRDELSDSRPG